MIDIWSAACSGDDNSIIEYFSSGNQKNVRFERFGSNHSLIMGALRNGKIGTVRLLQSYGETIESHEENEYRTKIKECLPVYYSEQIKALEGHPLHLALEYDKNGEYTVTSPEYPGFVGKGISGEDAYFVLCEWLRTYKEDA